MKLSHQMAESVLRLRSMPEKAKIGYDVPCSTAVALLKRGAAKTEAWIDWRSHLEAPSALWGLPIWAS